MLPQIRAYIVIVEEIKEPEDNKEMLKSNTCQRLPTWKCVDCGDYFESSDVITVFDQIHCLFCAQLK